ncbi:hypothetical protein N7471_008995 [Penicillium samsonianum]|uniref:uncharacterized protein n=1 Tax=Penicillium samsonianum TaxID=1882272 RepID=UPI0025497B9A|nr:uncharacterized protein N7471_008995 [Penicillium samsonianum]KAJ6127778.1 hypothetical protein N7471_008995 [Penicillium samsonianum]
MESKESRQFPSNTIFRTQCSIEDTIDWKEEAKRLRGEMHALKERGSDKAPKTGRTGKTIPTPSQGLNRTAPATPQKGSRTNKNSSQLKSGSSRPSQTYLDQ